MTRPTPRNDTKRKVVNREQKAKMFGNTGAAALRAYEKAKRDSENFNDPQAKRWGREVT